MTYLTLARMFHELPAALADSVVLPGVLGCRPLSDVPFGHASGPIPRYRGTVTRWQAPSISRSLRSAQSRKRVPSFMISRHQLMKHPG